MEAIAPQLEVLNPITLTKTLFLDKPASTLPAGHAFCVCGGGSIHRPHLPTWQVGTRSVRVAGQWRVHCHFSNVLSRGTVSLWGTGRGMGLRHIGTLRFHPTVDCLQIRGEDPGTQHVTVGLKRRGTRCGWLREAGAGLGQAGGPLSSGHAVSGITSPLWSAWGLHLQDAVTPAPSGASQESWGRVRGSLRKHPDPSQRTSRRPRVRVPRSGCRAAACQVSGALCPLLTPRDPKSGSGIPGGRHGDTPHVAFTSNSESLGNEQERRVKREL